jgi:hypothetical protein
VEPTVVGRMPAAERAAAPTRAAALRRVLVQLAE